MTSFCKKETSIDHSWLSSPRTPLDLYIYLHTYRQGLLSYLGTVEDLPRTAGIPNVGSKYCPSRMIYLVFSLQKQLVMTNQHVPTLHINLIPHQKWYHVFWAMWSCRPRNTLSAVYFHIWKKNTYKKLSPDNLVFEKQRYVMFWYVFVKRSPTTEHM